MVFPPRFGQRTSYGVLQPGPHGLCFRSDAVRRTHCAITRMHVSAVGFHSGATEREYTPETGLNTSPLHRLTRLAFISLLFPHTICDLSQRDGR